MGWVVVAVLTAAVLWFCWVINDEDRTNQVIHWINHHRKPQ